MTTHRLLDLYRLMSRIRQFENAAEIASQGGVAAWGLAASAKPALVRGPLHLSTGQEAVAAMGRRQQVGPFKVVANASSHGFLASRQMQRAAHQRGLGGCSQAPGCHTALAGNFGGVFKLADAAHKPIKVKQALGCHSGNAKG